MAKQVDTNTSFNMMNYSSHELLSVLKIFITSIKNFHKNKLLLLSITFLAIFLNIGVFLANLFLSLKPLSIDIVTNYHIFSTYDPTSTTSTTDFLQSIFKIQKDVTTLLGEQLIMILVLYVISMHSTVATIYVSAMSHLHKDITLKDLVLGTKKIWKKFVITSFYVSLLSIGCNLLFLPCVLFVVLLYFSSKLMFVFGIALLIFPTLLVLYLSVVSMSSLVVSVLEEDVYGFGAIGKAERLVRGNKVQGVVICLVFMVASSVLVFPSMSPRKVWITVAVTMAKMIFISSLTMFSWMVYIVFYFECKKSHGEEVEFEVDDMKYIKVPTVPLVDSALP
ncbi:hypothetical protein Scep_023411 [Stephania cephalantha]|uniref:Transmembrane protein n=1 Tax=Stephania cephalantha TaxID=152367 RepID=A0AAP0EUM5_9MAGN